jgi:hypothetical protein
MRSKRRDLLLCSDGLSSTIGPHPRRAESGPSPRPFARRFSLVAHAVADHRLPLRLRAAAERERKSGLVRVTYRLRLDRGATAPEQARKDTRADRDTGGFGRARPHRFEIPQHVWSALDGPARGAVGSARSQLKEDRNGSRTNPKTSDLGRAGSVRRLGSTRRGVQRGCGG